MCLISAESAHSIQAPRDRRPASHGGPPIATKLLGEVCLEEGSVEILKPLKAWDGGVVELLAVFQEEEAVALESLASGPCRWRYRSRLAASMAPLAGETTW